MSSSKQTVIEFATKLPSGRLVSARVELADDDVRIADAVAGYYTRCVSLSDADRAALVARARELEAVPEADRPIAVCPDGSTFSLRDFAI